MQILKVFDCQSWCEDGEVNPLEPFQVLKMVGCNDSYILWYYLNEIDCYFDPEAEPKEYAAVSWVNSKLIEECPELKDSTEDVIIKVWW